MKLQQALIMGAAVFIPCILLFLTVRIDLLMTKRSRRDAWRKKTRA